MVMPATTATRPVGPDVTEPSAAGGLSSTDVSGVWEVLDRWAGRENLEKRLIAQRPVDDVLLRAPERQAGAVMLN